MDNVQPDEICNLTGQSSVRLSFGQSVETLARRALGALMGAYDGEGKVSC